MRPPETFGLGAKMTDLQHWLEEIGLAQYADLFAANDIDLEILPDLTEQDFDSARYLPLQNTRAATPGCISAVGSASMCTTR